MESVVFDGKEYIKASVLAARFRYTADYLGQLCRGKKVDARLVGRAWYINLDSLNEHRKGRYKNAPQKQEPAAQKDKVVASVVQAKPASSSSSHYLSRIDVEPILKKKTVSLLTEKKGSLHQVPVKYEADDHALIPRVNKEAVSKNIPIIPAEAEEVKVHNDKQESRVTAFKAEVLPEVYLKGRLSVAGLEEASESVRFEEEEAKEPEIKPSRMEEAPKVKSLLVRKIQKLPSVPLSDGASVPKAAQVAPAMHPERSGVAISTSHDSSKHVLPKTHIGTPAHNVPPRPQHTAPSQTIPIKRSVVKSMPPVTEVKSTAITNKTKTSPQNQAPVLDVAAKQNLPLGSVPVTKKTPQPVSFKPATVLKTEAAKAEQKQSSPSVFWPTFLLLVAVVFAVLTLGIRQEISVGKGTASGSKFMFDIEQLRSRF